jgi:thiol-disulfide isomerase/thioredoxin
MIRNATIVVLVMLLVGCGTTPNTQTLDLPTLAPTIAPVNTEILPTNTDIPDVIQATATVQVVSMISTLPPTFTPTPTMDLYATSTAQAYQLQRQSMDLENQRLIMTLTAVPLELTPSLTPSITPIPVRAMPITTYYTLDPSRMRPCPYIDNDKCPNIVEIPRGRSVMVNGETDGDTYRNGDNWYQVTYNNQQGYIHAALLSINPPTATPRPPTPIPPTPQPAPQQYVDNSGSSGGSGGSSGNTVASNSTATLYYFYTDWCPYCQQEAPLISQVDGEYGSSLSVRWIDADDPSNQAIKAEYGVSGIPHMVFMNERGQVIRSSIGFTPIATLRNYINAALSS